MSPLIDQLETVKSTILFAGRVLQQQLLDKDASTVVRTLLERLLMSTRIINFAQLAVSRSTDSSDMKSVICMME